MNPFSEVNKDIANAFKSINWPVTGKTIRVFVLIVSQFLIAAAFFLLLMSLMVGLLTNNG